MITEDKNVITSDDILGKDVLDLDGEFIGIIQKLHIDKTTKKIVGITIDEGFMKPDLFVGIEHVKTFGVDSVFLSMSPNQKFTGLSVFDANGKKLGRVKSVDISTKSHKINSIEVVQNTKKFRIYAKDIDKIGYNVILKSDFIMSDYLEIKTKK